MVNPKSRNVKAQSSPVSSSASDVQTFFDRVSLIVRELNSRHYKINNKINPYYVIVQSMFHIETAEYITANDLALIQSELNAVDISMSTRGLSIIGEITN